MTSILARTEQPPGLGEILNSQYGNLGATLAAQERRRRDAEIRAEMEARARRERAARRRRQVIALPLGLAAIAAASFSVVVALS
jgi:hypothetical protein